MMGIINAIKRRFAKWIWRNNQWTKAVDDIERAAKELKLGEAREIQLHWRFKFLDEPNKFTIRVALS